MNVPSEPGTEQTGCATQQTSSYSTLQDFNMVKISARLQTYMQPIIVGAIKPN